MDIQGEPSLDNPKVLGLDDVIDFGKYKGQSLASVYATDAQYLRWLESNNDSFRIDWDSFQTQIQNCKDE